jgi:hypothetical protein
MDFKAILIGVNRIIKEFTAEAFIILGVFFIIFITFRICAIIGFYLLGLVLILFGLFLSVWREVNKR